MGYENYSFLFQCVLMARVYGIMELKSGFVSIRVISGLSQPGLRAVRLAPLLQQ
jgi:hypothetical protein